MRGGYRIVRYHWHLTSFKTEYLAHDGLWYSECEDDYPSPLEARVWFQSIFPDKTLRRVKYWIQGPNGGKHALVRKKVGYG